MTTATAPLALAIDDLHRGDAELVAAVEAALIAGAGRPLLVAVTARPELRRDRPWGARIERASRIALSPLSRLPLGAWKTYAKEVFEPTPCKVMLDGMRLPGDRFTGVHVASMSINLGNVLRFFGKADQPGLMNALVGTPSPWSIIRNIPRMTRGQEMRGRNILDRPCREMIIEATGDELLAPIIDGEFYRNVTKLEFRVGPRVRIPKVVAPKAA